MDGTFYRNSINIFVFYIIFFCLQFGLQAKSDPLNNNHMNNQLIAAIFNGKSYTVKKLLQLGANPNCLDEIGILDNKMQSALIVATDWRMRMTEGHVRIPGFFSWQST